MPKVDYFLVSRSICDGKSSSLFHSFRYALKWLSIGKCRCFNSVIQYLKHGIQNRWKCFAHFLFSHIDKIWAMKQMMSDTNTHNRIIHLSTVDESVCNLCHSYFQFINWWINNKLQNKIKFENKTRYFCLIIWASKICKNFKKLLEKHWKIGDCIKWMQKIRFTILFTKWKKKE